LPLRYTSHLTPQTNPIPGPALEYTRHGRPPPFPQHVFSLLTRLHHAHFCNSIWSILTKAANMKCSFTLALACLMPEPVVALVGTATDMYNPPCAHACRRAVASNMLSCSSHDAPGGHMHGGDSAMTSPQCRAGDTAFLTTLAWCMSTKCAQYHVPTWRLEKFWQEQCTGDPAVAPKWDYGTALQHVTQPPTRELTMDDALEVTALAPEATWELQYRTLTFFEAEERVHARYGYGPPQYHGSSAEKRELLNF
jgi:hypothetical protein